MSGGECEIGVAEFEFYVCACCYFGEVVAGDLEIEVFHIIARFGSVA